MITLTGKSVFGGVEIGKIAFYKRNKQQIKRLHVDDTEVEVARFEEAKTAAIVQLQKLHKKAVKDVGEENAMIFEIHQMIRLRWGLASALSFWVSQHQLGFPELRLREWRLMQRLKVNNS